MSGEALLGAVEAGGTKFVCAVGRAAPGRVATPLMRATIDTGPPDETFERVNAFFEDARRAHGAIAALGVAAFGPIDNDPASSTYGVVRKTPKTGWTGANYLAALGRVSDAIRLDTDVNGAALGEATTPTGQGLKTFAYVTVGTGIGVGVLRDGAPLNGVGHYEMGHLFPPRDPVRDPFPGRCPFHGACVEGLASGPAIRERWGAPLNEAPDGAVALIGDYLGYLAQAIFLTHAPARIVFGGGVMKTDGLIREVRRAAAERLGGYVDLPHLSGDLSDAIVPPALGDDAGLTGAFELARAELAARERP